MTLIQKLVQLRKQIKGLDQTGRNNFSKYDYSTESDLLNAYVQPMLDAGLYVIQDVVEQDITIEERGGSSYSVAKLRIKISIVDSESEDAIESHFPGFATDKNADKAAYKALTGGIKYGMKKLLHLDSGIDGDSDNGSMGGRENQSSNGLRSTKNKPEKSRATAKPAKSKAAPKKAASAKAKPVSNSQKLCLAASALGYGKEHEYWIVNEAAMQYWSMDQVPKKGWAEDYDGDILIAICRQMWIVVAQDMGYPGDAIAFADGFIAGLGDNNMSTMSTAFLNGLKDALASEG